MSDQTKIEVLAVIDKLIDWMPDINHPDNQMPQVLADHREASEVRKIVSDLINIQRRLVAWNRNVNGTGTELGEICADAETAIGSIGGDQ